MIREIQFVSWKIASLFLLIGALELGILVEKTDAGLFGIAITLLLSVSFLYLLYHLGRKITRIESAS